MTIATSNGLPVLGHTLDFFHDYLGTHQRLHEKYGDMVEANVFFHKAVYVYSAEANRAVLQDPDGVFSARRGYWPLMSQLFTEGLLLKDGADHKAHRRIMQKSFQREAMTEYLCLMRAQVQHAIARWPTGRPFKLYPALKNLALDIACTVFAGSSNPKESDTLGRNFDVILSGTSAFIKKPVPGLQFWKSMRARHFVEHYFRRKIGQQRQSADHDLFSRLCQAKSDEGEQLSDDDIINHMVFILFAAHETTTTAISTLLAELAKNPELQERLRAECRLIGGKEHVLTHEDLERLQFMEWSLNEAMRLNPPVLTYIRRATRNCLLEGQPIRAKQFVIVTPAVAQRSARWWTNPEQFDPERFSPGRAEHRRHPGCWIPFGAGAHTCLGMRFAYLEASLILFTILQHYRIRFKSPEYRPLFRQIPTAIPTDGLPLVLEPIT